MEIGGNPEERTTRHNDLLFALGYCALVLETKNLSPTDRELYEQRLRDVEAELEVYLNEN